MKTLTALLLVVTSAAFADAAKVKCDCTCAVGGQRFTAESEVLKHFGNKAAPEIASECLAAAAGKLVRMVASRGVSETDRATCWFDFGTATPVHDEGAPFTKDHSFGRCSTKD